MSFWKRNKNASAENVAEQLKLAENLTKQMGKLTGAMKAELEDRENIIVFEADDEGDLWRMTVARLLGRGTDTAFAAKQADLAVLEYRKRLPKKSVAAAIPTLNR